MFDQFKKQVIDIKTVSYYSMFLYLMPCYLANICFEFNLIIIQAVLEALNERDYANGQVSGAKLKEILEGFQSEILTGVQNQIAQIQSGQVNNHMSLPPSSVNFNDVDGAVPTYCNGKYRAFCYAEDASLTRKFWMVPKRFKFPKADRRAAWNFWLLGMPDHQEENAEGDTVTHPVCPFCVFDPKLLPKKLRDNFKNNWRPVLRIMDEAIMSGSSHPTIMNANEVAYWWEAGTDILKTRASYIFCHPRSYLWGVGTWSKHVLPSYIKGWALKVTNWLYPLLLTHGAV